MRDLSFRAPPTLAVAENATTPTGRTGALIWSTTASKLLVWDGSKWAAPAPTAGGGGGSGDVVGPASAAADSLVTFADETGKVLKEATFFDVPDIGGIPAAPSAAHLRHFARNRAGRVMPHFIGPAGIDVAMQPALFGNSIAMWSPSTGTTVSTNFGTSWTARNSGTGAAQAHPTRASTNALTSLIRATFGTGTTATGSSGIQSALPVAWRGNAANLGGFYATWRFAVETLSSDIQLLIGLSALNAALAGEPSAQNNTFALCKDAADTTWQIVSRNTTLVKTNLGATITAGQILDFTIFAPPNGSGITVRLVDAVTGTVLVDNVQFTGGMPSNTTFLYAHAQIRSTTTTTAKLLALNRIYVETDL